MGKKLTIEYVKDSFEKEGYVLLSEVYINNKHKLDYSCPKGHKHSIAWNDWQQIHRCPTCAGNTTLVIEYVRTCFNNANYILVSKVYKNAYTKLDYICSKGHKHSITWTDWQQGHRCPYCVGQGKPTLSTVKKSFEKEGYTLISDKYKRSKDKLGYTCKEGHTHLITWADWQQGYRCPTCSHIKNAGTGHYNWKGGISFEPYCEVWKDKEYKQSIRDRDNNKCLNPYCNSKNPNDLTIHHIDYNKKNCKPSNLITICRSCNSMANKNRTWHKAWYRAIIKNRY